MGQIQSVLFRALAIHFILVPRISEAEWIGKRSLSLIAVRGGQDIPDRNADNSEKAPEKVSEEVPTSSLAAESVPIPTPNVTASELESTVSDEMADDLNDSLDDGLRSTEEDSSANVDRMEYADVEEMSYTGDYEPTEDASLAADEDEQEDQSNASTAKETEERPPPVIPLFAEITPQMEAILINELKYRASDLEVMRPDIASIVVAKKLRRPSEGLPHNWIDNANKSKAPAVASSRVATKRSVRSIGKTILVVVLSALAAGAGAKVAFDLDVGTALLSSLGFLSSSSSSVSSSPPVFTAPLKPVAPPVLSFNEVFGPGVDPYANALLMLDRSSQR